jgi:PleD family two-component response regulator
MTFPTTFAGPCAYCNCCTSSPHVGEFSRGRDWNRKAGVAAANGSPILIVDDDASYRASVASILGLVGYGPRKASSGEEMLSSVRSERPSWVLLDVLLPGVTGCASVAS